MRTQRRSETIRKGSPPSHEHAVLFIAAFLLSNWRNLFNSYPNIHTPYNVIFPQDWVERNKLGYRIHSYDLGVTIVNELVMIVEVGAIGDDSKHNPTHKQQLINDGIAKRFIEEDSPTCRFYRINKDDSLITAHLEKLFLG